MTRPLCVCRCGRRAANRHHVVYKQHLTEPRRRRDARNLVWIAYHCHGQHHAQGAGKLLLAVLPDSAYEFAAEVLGSKAYGYLRRRYAGEDERLEALLQIPAPIRAPVGRRTRS